MSWWEEDKRDRNFLPFHFLHEYWKCSHWYTGKIIRKSTSFSYSRALFYFHYLSLAASFKEGGKELATIWKVVNWIKANRESKKIQFVTFVNKYLTTSCLPVLFAELGSLTAVYTLGIEINWQIILIFDSFLPMNYFSGVNELDENCKRDEILSLMLLKTSASWMKFLVKAKQNCNRVIKLWLQIDSHKHNSISRVVKYRIWATIKCLQHPARAESYFRAESSIEYLWLLISKTPGSWFIYGGVVISEFRFLWIQQIITSVCCCSFED